jgi:hypothetical protein
MFTNQSATQKSWATGPLPGRGNAPVVAAVQGDSHLSAFVTADLRFDIAAIRADAKARYALKLDFINRYSGTARRWWQLRQARQALRQSWSEAKLQLHNAVLARMPRDLPFTPQERSRLADLRAMVTGMAPASPHGMAGFKAASGEYKTIQWTAQQRAYFQIIAEARGAADQAVA